MRNEEVTDYIETAAEDQLEILNELRELIFTASPDVKEQFKWSRPVYATDRDFCYLKIAKKYVTLGFFQFDKIRTNKKMLEGTGKQMRHIKIKNMDDIQLYNIRAILNEVLE